MIETNKIYCGDNLELLRNKTLFPDNSIDLIYLDPPFFSQKKYEQIWGDKDEVRSFEDRWSGGITHYIGWMSERLSELHRVLKSAGSIYLHCDWHASHNLKLEMDKVFGYNNFQTEIIWNYRRYSQSSVKGKRFEHTHDSIFHYTKTDTYIFNPVLESVNIPINDCSKVGFKKDTKGYFKTAPTGQGIGGYSDKTIAELDSKGLIYWTRNGKARKKYYCENDDVNIIDKKMLGNVWIDVPDMMHASKNEIMGYPTQKPESLLERIILTSSNENDIILDPFCGCGTTVAVAKRLNRKFIGIDISPIACKLIASRIGYPEFDIIGLPVNTTDLAKMKPHEFQQWICDKMLAKNTSPDPKKHSGSDKGIDGIVNYSIEYPHIHGSPIQVKQSDGVGINVVKNLYATMLGIKAKTGFIVALSFGSGAVEQVAKYKMEENEALRVDIKLIKAEDLCKIKYYDYGSILA